jgi:hypothetical protein
MARQTCAQPERRSLGAFIATRIYTPRRRTDTFRSAHAPALAMTIELYTAADLAKFCSVELRTIHNWMRKSPSAHQLTPGGQRRFSRLQAVDFLRSHAFSVPRALRTASPAIALVASNAVSKLALTALGRKFAVTSYANLLDAALDAQTLAFEAIVFDVADTVQSVADAQAILSRLAAHKELATRRRIGFLAQIRPELEPLCSACVMHANPGQLRATLQQALGCVA